MRTKPLHRVLCAAGVVVTSLAGGLRAQELEAPSLRTQTTVVLVPALVQDRAGKPVYTLKADDFALTDDGVPQKLVLELESGDEPLSLVVLVEVGGAGARQFRKYATIAPPLAPMLPSIIGHVDRRVAVVTFDSTPRTLQSFTSDLDEAADALRSLEPGCTRQQHHENCTGPNPIHDKRLGDNGAAILDSLEYALSMLREEPPTYRKAILLVSETLDRGSKTSIAQAVRDLTDTNTTIYSVAYSTAKSETVHYAQQQLPTQSGGPSHGNLLSFENPHPNPPHGCMGKDSNPDPDATKNRWVQAYDCLAQLAPPLTFAKMAAIATLDGLRRNVPETVAQLTGGEYYRMSDVRSMERDLAAISNHLPNRYVLSFHPQSPHPGLHNLKLTAPEYDGLSITARTTYWADADATHP